MEVTSANGIVCIMSNRFNPLMSFQLAVIKLSQLKLVVEMNCFAAS